MQKLKLDLESLAVETFETSGDSTSRGTVYAYDGSLATSGGPYFCPYECSGGSECGQC